MLAEGGTFVVVDFKPVRHVDLEALLVDLKTHRTQIDTEGVSNQTPLICKRRALFIGVKFSHAFVHMNSR